MARIRGEITQQNSFETDFASPLSKKEKSRSLQEMFDLTFKFEGMKTDVDYDPVFPAITGKTYRLKAEALCDLGLGAWGTVLAHWQALGEGGNNSGGAAIDDSAASATTVYSSSKTDAIYQLKGTAASSGVIFTIAPAKVVTITGAGATRSFDESAAVVNNGSDISIPAATLSFNIAAAEKKRIDIVIAKYNTTSQVINGVSVTAIGYYVITGTEVNAADIVSTPAVPANALLVREINVTDAGAAASTPVTYAKSASINGKAAVVAGADGNIALIIDDTINFEFDSDLGLSQEFAIRGSINNLSVILGTKIASVAYAVKTDAGTYTTQASLSAVQTWVNSNVTASVTWWLQLTATYTASAFGKGVAILNLRR